MIIIKQTNNLKSTIYNDSLSLRKKIFIEEQGVPQALEIDNEASCVHFVLYNEELPLATVRLLKKAPTTYKIQRMAVAKEARKKGYGKKIMLFIEKYAQEQGMTDLILGAQITAIPFYESLGYKSFGDEYLDAGIKHFDMKKRIN